MIFTNCCNHEFIGDNHSPIRPDGYCLHCGFHPEIESLKAEISIYKANERLARQRNEELQKEIEELKLFIKDIHQRLRDNESELRLLADIEKLLEARERRND